MNRYLTEEKKTYKKIIHLIKTQKMHIKTTVRHYFIPINLAKEVQQPQLVKVGRNKNLHSAGHNINWNTIWQCLVKPINNPLLSSLFN